MQTPNNGSMGSYSMHISTAQRVKRVREIIHLKPGDVLEGKYRLMGEIGAGGMGIVYEAEHVSLSIKMAVKVLLPTVTDVNNVVDRFKIEARSAASIRHPNVVEVTDFGLTPDRRPFFVMEHLKGESLAERLANRPVLKQREIVEMVDQILSGLAIAHKQGVIHRDLKPENVFLAKTSGGKELVKLLDFGIAKILGGPSADPAVAQKVTTDSQPKLSLGPDGRSLTMHGMVLGTPGYLAPEVAAAKSEADARSDLFSVGVMMYEALAGRPPFRGESVNDVLKATVTDPVVRLKQLNPGVSKEMERLIHTALAKKPVDRFQNTEEFMRHLTAAAVGRLPSSPRRCVTTLTTLASAATGSPSGKFNMGEQDGIDTMDAPAVTDAEEPQSASAPPVAIIRESIPEAVVPEKESQRGPALFIAIGLLVAALAGGGAYLFFETGEEKPAEVETIKEVETVSLWLELVPRKARVLVDGKETRERPVILEKSDKPVEFQVSMAGYLSKTQEIIPSKVQSLKIVLEPVSKPSFDAGTADGGQ